MNKRSHQIAAWSCVLGLAMVFAVRDASAADDNTQRNSDEIVGAVRYVGKNCPDVAVPVLGELFRHVPRNTHGIGVIDNPDNHIHPVRKAVIEATASLHTQAGYNYLWEIMREYLEQGSFGPPYNPTDDDEYYWVLSGGGYWNALITNATPDLKKWFWDVSQDKLLIHEIRMKAFEGYMKFVLAEAKLATVEQRVTWLLDGLTPAGGSEWDRFIQPQDPILSFTTLQDWAIRDYGRLAMIRREGQAALPVLEKKWQELEAQKPLDDVKQWKQYYIAGVMSGIYGESNLVNPHDNRLTRPPNADQEWLRNAKAHHQLVLKFRKQRGLAEGEAPKVVYPDPSKIIKPPKPLPPNADDPLVKELIAAIQKVGETKRPEVLPVLRELYRTTPKDGAKPGEIHPVRKAIAEAVEKIAGKGMPR